MMVNVEWGSMGIESWPILKYYPSIHIKKPQSGYLPELRIEMQIS
jgi:hypothetical protein